MADEGNSAEEFGARTAWPHWERTGKGAGALDVCSGGWQPERGLLLTHRSTSSMLPPPENGRARCSPHASLRSPAPLLAQQIFYEEKGQTFSIMKNNLVHREKQSYHTAVTQGAESEVVSCVSE